VSYAIIMQGQLTLFDASDGLMRVHGYLGRVLPCEGETSHVTLIESVNAGTSDSEMSEMSCELDFI
jgi:hypothetical protein